MRARRPASALLLLAIATTLGACGSGSSTSTESPSAAAPAAHDRASRPENSAPRAAAAAGAKAGQGGESAPAAPGSTPERHAHSFVPPTHHDSGGGSGQFETKGGDNSIQENGSEADAAEFEAAATALHGYLDARAVAAWSAACGYLAAGVGDQFNQSASAEGGGKGKVSCGELLAGLSAGIPAAALREEAVADVGSLRVEGDSAFLLFHGAHGVEYFIPMLREDGEWKVAAIAPSALV